MNAIPIKRKNFAANVDVNVNEIWAKVTESFVSSESGNNFEDDWEVETRANKFLINSTLSRY